MARVLAFDVSLKHGAACLAVNGKLRHYWYFSDIASAAKRPGRHGMYLPPKPKDKNNKDQQQYQMFRLVWIRDWIRVVVRVARPQYIGIEDYALHMEHRSHYLGEVGGAARMVFWDAGLPFRMSDPVSCKMFVTHDGTAQKDLVEKCVCERWGVDFTSSNGLPPKDKKMNRQTSEDLADAFGLCQLVETEVLLRAGEIRLSSLHKKEVQVFNRLTKTYPTSLLDREFIQRPERRPKKR